MSTDVRAITATRIEKLADTFEELALALAAKQIARSKSTDGVTPKILDQFLAEARLDIRGALKEFLAPIVRLVDCGPRQVDKTQDVLGPQCRQCGRIAMCNTEGCEHWHAAIRAAIKQNNGDAA